jgi:hypothetical protein
MPVFDRSCSGLQQTLDMLGEHVDLEVHSIALPILPRLVR